MYGNVKKTKRTLRNRASGFIKGLAASFDAETLNVDGHMEAMFEGSEFSEEFIERAGTIFKSAVGQEIQVQLQEIDEQVESHITEVEEQLAEEMSENVDKYLNYVTEQWMEDNQVAVEQQLRTELAEDFIVGLKGLFDAHYIDVPESKVDLVDALQEKVVSRKLLVFLTATGLLVWAGLDADTWGMIAMCYIGGQSAIDFAKTWKG